jgi:5-methylcytosine-specific restriction enzyme A
MLGEGKIYRRRDLHAKLGGQQQSGISTPSQYPVIMIFSGESGKNYGYQDGWQENDVYYYTGEGQEGDMKFTKGNKAIRDHLLNGKDIWLFKNHKSVLVKFVGKMICTGYHHRTAPDRNGHNREAIVFELIRKKK